MIATLAALVLGLLVSSAKGSYDAMNDGLKLCCARAVLLDRVLAQFCPDASEARSALQTQLATALELLWPREQRGEADLHAIEGQRGPEELQEKCSALVLRTEPQRDVRVQALQICGKVAKSHWLMIEHAQNNLPLAFLVVLVSWLTLLHLGFGLLAPRNAIIAVVLFVCAISVSAALFLILELNHPISGMIKLSSAPLGKALQLRGL